jgi:O-antigen/teichoic acid export membrane protein
MLIKNNFSVTQQNIVANNIGSAYNVITLLIAIPIYVKYLGIENYSFIAIFMIISAWSVIMDFGLKSTVERKISLYKANDLSIKQIAYFLRSVEIFTMLIGALFVFLMWLAFVLLPNNQSNIFHLPIEEIKKSFILISVIISFRSIEAIYNRTLKALQKQVLQNIISIFVFTIQNLGSIFILIFISPTLEAFFIWNTITSLISLIIFRSAVYFLIPVKKEKASFSWPDLLDSWNFTIGMFFITFLGLLTAYIDKFMATKFFTSEIFSYYALAFTITKILGMFSDSVSAAVYPRLIELSLNNNDDLKKFYHKSSQLISVVAGSLASILFIFSDEVVMVWTNNATLKANIAPILAIIVVGELARTLSYIPNRLQIAHAWVGLNIKINIMISVLLIPIILYVSPIYGAIGMAFSWSFVNLMFLFIGVYLMHRRLLIKEFIYWLNFDILIPILSSFIVAIICYQLMPEELNRVEMFFGLLISFIFSLTVASLVTPLVRKSLLVKSYLD